MKHTALVTGASRGIGAAIAEELAAAGCAVLVNYRSDAARAAEVKARIEAAGGEATLLPFDVGDAAATAAALAPYEKGERTIDIVVNNAGVVRDAPFPGMERGDWELVTRTVLDGFYNVTRPLVMPLVRRRWGRIINIASLAGVVGNRGQVNYSAAKAGLIDTEMVKNLPLDEVTKMIPMRRMGRAEEVAKLVRFLASDDAGYITGQVIGINGGWA